MRSLLLLLLFPLLIFPAAVLATEVPVVVEEKVYNDYIEFLDGRDPLEIRDFTGPKARRSTIEIVLIQQAFSLGDMPVTFKFEFAPGAERMRRMVLLHGYAMQVNTVWRTAVSENSDDLWISQPFIRDTEFEAGLYTIATREDLLKSGDQIQLEMLKAVSSSHWISDWNTLKELPLKDIVDVPEWRTMVNMVAYKRVDFLLAPFQVTDDLSFTSRDYHFKPIEGVKLGLRGSRHFIISKNYPNSEALNNALNRGLSVLRQSGTIERALKESGFLNSQVAGWTKLN